jgi:hypothetical protein
MGSRVNYRRAQSRSGRGSPHFRVQPRSVLAFSSLLPLSRHLKSVQLHSERTGVLDSGQSAMPSLFLFLDWSDTVPLDVLDQMQEEKGVILCAYSTWVEMAISKRNRWCSGERMID